MHPRIEKIILIKFIQGISCEDIQELDTCMNCPISEQPFVSQCSLHYRQMMAKNKIISLGYTQEEIFEELL